MHEGSLVERLLDQVQALASEHGDAAVRAIDVDIGPLSGVEPELVESAFARMAPERDLATTIFRIRLVPLIIRCERCAAVETLDRVEFRCPRCGHDRVSVEQGDALILQSVTLEQTDADQSDTEESL